MANLKGLAGFVAKLKATRTSLVIELRHVDAALSVLGKLGGGSNSTKPKHTILSLGSQADEPRAASAMGKGEGSSTETKAHNISSSPQKENRGGTKGTGEKFRAGEE